MVSEQVKGLLE